MNSKNRPALLLNPTFQFKAGKGYFLCLSITHFCIMMETPIFVSHAK